MASQITVGFDFGMTPTQFAWFLKNNMTGVKITVGQGPWIDGLPVGFVLVEKDDGNQVR
jgi:hypothetical protein